MHIYLFSGLVVGAVISALILPAKIEAPWSTAVMRVLGALGVGVLAVGFGHTSQALERTERQLSVLVDAEARYRPLLGQYEVNRRIAFAGFIDTIEDLSKPALSPVNEVFIGCHDCTNIGEILLAFARLADAGSTRFRVNWIAAEHADHTELTSAVDGLGTRWLQCYVLPAERQIELRMNLRGSVFVRDNGTLSVSNVESLYARGSLDLLSLRIGQPSSGQNGEYWATEESDAELMRSRLAEYRAARDSSVACGKVAPAAP